MPTNAELAADLKAAKDHVQTIEDQLVALKKDWDVCAEENDRLKSALDAANAAGADPALQEKLDALPREQVKDLLLDVYARERKQSDSLRCQLSSNDQDYFD